MTIEFEDILNCSFILLTFDLSFVIVWIWFLFWLMPLILSWSNLSYISFNIIFVGGASCIFDFLAFIGLIKSWFRDLAKYDDDDDKVEEKFEEKVSFDDFDVFDVSPIFPLGIEENKNYFKK